MQPEEREWRTRHNAKQLRGDMTEAEAVLWKAVRAHRLSGLSFRRQMPIDKFIVDFACPQHRLVVELDGPIHDEKSQAEYDQRRTRYLESQGWTVIRFGNVEVMSGIGLVCSKIVSTLQQKGVEFA